jgi:hypothetical protein
MNKKTCLSVFMVLIIVLIFPSLAAATGNITVSSVPPGSKVLVDGIETGATTPTTIESVSSGTHYLLLRLTGYQDYTQNVIVNNNATSTISVTLSAVTTTAQQITNGSIKVESNPSNAAVFLNTEYQGKTPLTLYNVTHGTYRIQVQKIGYEDWSERISVTSGVRTDVYAPLETEVTDTTAATSIPTASTVKTTVSRTSTAKVPTSWPSGTSTPASPLSALAVIGAIGFGIVAIKRRN